MTRTYPLVLHVLPMDLARGAQRYARAMRDLLDGEGMRHRTLTIFPSDVRVLDADVKLDVPRSAIGRRGFEPRAALALARAVAEFSPAVVVAHGSEPLKYLAAALPLRVPLVYYKIGVVHEGARRPARRLLHAALLRRADFIAGVSEECLEEAATVFGVRRQKLVLVPNGRDPAQYFPRGEGAASGRPVVTFVGHLTASKRPEAFVELVRRLRERGLPLDARVIGDGPLAGALAPRAAAAGVELLGRRDDVPELLRSSDVLVFTSVPEGEGMPGVFIEAGLSGLPVVTTDVPGARTVVSDGRTGFVVPVDDADALEERTARLLEDAPLRERLGRAARARCKREFSLASSADRWAVLLRRALA